MNKPVAWVDKETGCFVYSQYDYEDLDEYGKDGLIPLYTQEQLEEARKLGMQQERALWNLAESTQEFESFDRTASHMAGEYVAHKELNDGGEPVKNATYWKRQYNLMATQNDNLKSGLYHANEQIKYLESHPVKELTDEEIIKEALEIGFIVEQDLSYEWREYTQEFIACVKAILRKAQEK